MPELKFVPVMVPAAFATPGTKYAGVKPVTVGSAGPIFSPAASVAVWPPDCGDWTTFTSRRATCVKLWTVTWAEIVVELTTEMFDTETPACDVSVRASPELKFVPVTRIVGATLPDDGTSMFPG